MVVLFGLDREYMLLAEASETAGLHRLQLWVTASDDGMVLETENGRALAVATDGALFACQDWGLA